MKNRRYRGERDALVQAILALLEEQGPMTTGEMCIALGRHIREMASVVSRLRKPLATLPKRIYVIDWVWEDEHSKRKFWRARYALGDLSDKRKPRPDPLGAKMRHYYKANVPNSVFDIGTTRKAREARQKQIRAEHAQMKQAEAALEAMARDAQELGLGYGEDVRQVP